jgi:hypothetical protein
LSGPGVQSLDRRSVEDRLFKQMIHGVPSRDSGEAKATPTA